VSITNSARYKLMRPAGDKQLLTSLHHLLSSSTAANPISPTRSPIRLLQIQQIPCFCPSALDSPHHPQRRSSLSTAPTHQLMRGTQSHHSRGRMGNGICSPLEVMVDHPRLSRRMPIRRGISRSTLRHGRQFGIGKQKDGETNQQGGYIILPLEVAAKSTSLAD
jgi:hypothetical protein